jgi:glyoxalase family protein
MDLRLASRHPAPDGETFVYEVGQGGPAAELHVAAQPSLPPAGQGAGGAHHVAFCTPDADGLRAWIRRLGELGVGNSGEVDRYYFRSLYFREPGGVLFEIATDGPALPSTSRRKAWASACRCRRSWSRAGQASRRG